MCVWTGYIGRREAAPILLAAGKKIEGFWSGHYTGLVTLDPDGFHGGKVVGDLRAWEKEYRAAGFPGKTGLFHSRTPSGGGREWAHPFISPAGTLAVVAQGHVGVFKDQAEAFIEAGNRMLEGGRRFTSADYSGQRGCYAALKDGSEVHISEIVEQAVDLEHAQGRSHMEAIRRGLSSLPLESVFVFLFRDRPGSIFVANVNQRVVFGEDRDGIYLSTTSLAMPGDVGRVTEIPGNTLAEVSLDKVVFETIAPLFECQAALPAGLEEAFVAYLKRNPGVPLHRIKSEALWPLFTGKGLECCVVAAYRILEKLAAAGRIRFENHDVPGVANTPAVVSHLFYQG